VDETLLEKCRGGTFLEVRWYLRYGLSYRDVKELLAERGVEVDHVTVYRWVTEVHPAAYRGCPTVPARHR
jgi:transposase-like protein